uniref:Putative secreted protein n=1 Tax=Anopheles triannulatus TaxID=58253 RepID=A0A2M4B0K1_9DIPT
MRHQLLLVLTVSLCAIAVNSSPALKPDLPKAKDPLFDKMLAETSRPIPNAHDPRFNKMLPDPDNNLIADGSDEDEDEEGDLLNDDILPEKALDLNPKYAQKAANKDKPEVSTVGSVAVNKVKINDDIDNYEAQLLKGNGKKLVSSQATTSGWIA